MKNNNENHIIKEKNNHLSIVKPQKKKKIQISLKFFWLKFQWKITIMKKI